MKIDVGKAIQELLFDNDTVILPGLGGLTATPMTAAVDYVQGTVQPPSKKIEFNANLTINDGILVNHIQKSEVVTAKEAAEAIEAYVSSIQESLDNREIIDIPNVGRLYKDYEQKIRFMPENTNFKVESFGLPTVSFNPIAKKKTPANAEAASTISAATAARPKPYQRSYAPQKLHWAEKALPWLIVFAGILLAFSLFMWLQDDSTGTQAAVPEGRVNVKPNIEETVPPAIEETADPNTADNNATSDVPPSDSPESEVQPPPQASIDNAAPTTKSTFIVIHSFGVKKNADQFIRTLERGGYTSVTQLHGGLHRVGVEIQSNDPTEIERMINELGRKFKSTPVVVEY